MEIDAKQAPGSKSREIRHRNKSEAVETCRPFKDLTLKHDVDILHTRHIRFIHCAYYLVDWVLVFSNLSALDAISLQLFGYLNCGWNCESGISGSTLDSRVRTTGVIDKKRQKLDPAQKIDVKYWSKEF